MQSPPKRRAFSFVELIAIIVAIAVLLCCTVALAPQQAEERDRAVTMANLRQISTAAVTYSAEFNDRQMTLVNDNLSSYGLDAGQSKAGENQRTPLARCVESFAVKNLTPHPAVVLGYTKDAQGQGEIAALKMDDAANHWALMPVSFDAQPRGWFRLVNARAMSQYLNGRFYDPVFYAANDQAALNAVGPLFNKNEEFTWGPKKEIYFSSYCFSAAALWSPNVLGRPSGKGGGFTDPFSTPHSFRSPSMSQAAYPNLKSHIMEHHWLHNRPEGTRLCNPKRAQGTYNGCEPYYFNHAVQSEPMTVFFDGHVDKLSVKDAIDSDARMKQQTEQAVGLWFSKPGAATDGYYESEAVDDTRASSHIYTIDGIKGRDVWMQ
jgi:hypothetical protein